MSYECLSFSIVGAVAQIKFNRPASLNAFNAQLRAELLSALNAVDADDAIRTVVLGAEGRMFSSGADLAEGLGGAETIEQQILQEYAPALEKICHLNKPIIAAVSGGMAGIGGAFAMACDLMVMADDAYLLLAFTNIALVPDGGVSWQLLRRMGYSRAFQAIVEGARLSAQECVDAGIASKLAAADQVDEVALQWAAALSERAPIALRETKKILRQALDVSYMETVALEAKAQNICVATQDAQEAVKAFMEKRPAVFVGK